MAMLNDWVLKLQGAVSEHSFDAFRKHVLEPRAPLQVFARRVVLVSQQAADATWPLVQPFVDRITVMLHESSDVVVLVVLALCLYAVLVVLSWVRRVMMFWAKMTAYLFFWACLVALGAVVYQHGLEPAMTQTLVIFGKVAGFASGLLSEGLSRDGSPPRSGGSSHTAPSRRNGWI